MDDAQADRAAFDTAERLLGAPLVLPLGPGEPPSGADFRRLATRHTFGDSWTRTGLDLRSRALVSVTIAATLGAREPLRSQLRIALSNGSPRQRSLTCSFTWRRTPAPPERSTATRSRWRSSRKPRAPSSRPDPQAGAGREPYRAVRCPAGAGASGGARAERQPGRTRAARRLGAAALLRVAVVCNIPVACNRATADFMISSPLMGHSHQGQDPASGQAHHNQAALRVARAG